MENRKCMLIVNSVDRKDDDITYVDEIMYGLHENIIVIYSFCGYDTIAIIMSNRYGCNIFSIEHSFEKATKLLDSVDMDYCILMPSKCRDDSITEDIIRRFPIKDNLFVR